MSTENLRYHTWILCRIFIVFIIYRQKTCVIWASLPAKKFFRVLTFFEKGASMNTDKTAWKRTSVVFAFFQRAAAAG